MNNLDALLQSIAKRADAQGTKATVQFAEIGSSQGKEAEAPIFAALLRTLSNQGEESKAQGESQVGARLPMYEGGTIIQSAGLFEEERQEAGRDETGLSQGEHPGETARVELPRSDVALLAQVAAQPQMGQPLPAQTSRRDDTRSGSSSSLLDMINLPTEEIKETQTLQDLGVPFSRKASVLHQETHFKPLAMETQPPAARAQVAPTPQPLVDGEVAEPKLEIRNTEQTEPVDSVASLPQKSPETHPQPAAASGEKGAPDASQSNAILQRIADVVAADAKLAPPEESLRIQRSEFQVPASIKASGGVLRVLDIQLRPAELGLVTVRMRLNGDTLEMELHASQDETAELLRKDTEKLSSLLRTSGYRPDVITILSGGTDAPQQDSGFGQRQSAMSHAGSQFGGSQGGDAHGRQPGRGAESFDEGNRGGQRSEIREISAGSRDTGDLYL